MTVAIKGQPPAWLPLDELLSVLAPLERFANRHDGVLIAECAADVVDISCQSTKGMVCIECGRALDSHIDHVSQFGKPQTNGRAIMMRFCAKHPTREPRRGKRR